MNKTAILDLDPNIVNAAKQNHTLVITMRPNSTNSDYFWIHHQIMKWNLVDAKDIRFEEETETSGQDDAFLLFTIFGEINIHHDETSYDRSNRGLYSTDLRMSNCVPIRIKKEIWHYFAHNGFDQWLHQVNEEKSYVENTGHWGNCEFRISVDHLHCLELTQTQFEKFHPNFVTKVGTNSSNPFCISPTKLKMELESIVVTTTT